MQRLHSLLLMALLIPVGCYCATDEEEIRVLFKRYENAMDANDGKVLIECIDAKSVQFYQDALRDALIADKATVRKMPFAQCMTVLTLRRNFSREQLSKMTLLDAFSALVKEDAQAKEDRNQLKINRVAVDGMAAQAFVAEMPDAPMFFFKKEMGKWHFELWRLMSMADATISQTANALKITEDELILRLLQRGVDKKIDESIYEPPK